jgi:hypothetical protein
MQNICVANNSDVDAVLTINEMCSAPVFELQLLGWVLLIEVRAIQGIERCDAASLEASVLD